MHGSATRSQGASSISCRRLPAPISVEVGYKDQRKAYAASSYPGARLVSPTSIVFETGDWFEALRVFLFVI